MSLLDELKATEKEWQRQGDYSHSDTLLEAIEEIERLRVGLGDLSERIEAWSVAVTSDGYGGMRWYCCPARFVPLEDSPHAEACPMVGTPDDPGMRDIARKLMA